MRYAMLVLTLLLRSWGVLRPNEALPVNGVPPAASVDCDPHNIAGLWVNVCTLDE
jgi:hypothetical protein